MSPISPICATPATVPTDKQSTPNVMPIKDAKKRIIEAVSSWGGITLTPHRFGGTACMLGKRELGIGKCKSTSSISRTRRVGDSAFARPTARRAANAPKYTVLNRRWTQIYADKRVTANRHELTRIKIEFTSEARGARRLLQPSRKCTAL
jgi:luciferase-like monooxygenase